MVTLASPWPSRKFPTLLRRPSVPHFGGVYIPRARNVCSCSHPARILGWDGNGGSMRELDPNFDNFQALMTGALAALGLLVAKLLGF